MCQHAGMKLVKRFLQLPLDVNAFKSRVLGRAGDAESAVEKPPAPVLSLKLFCFHLGSEEIPAGITPESKELGPDVLIFHVCPLGSCWNSSFIHCLAAL
uniref:Uncharacterized protein n=1 Tax=Taeniopygia guttata TaxID=59729 RepID=A0A674H7G1_TAEGU